MMTKWLVLFVVLALCGCSSSQQAQVSQPHRFAWDGLGRDPNLPVMKRAHTAAGASKLASEAELARLRPDLPEWAARFGSIDAEEHARISKLLIICRGCDLASTEADRKNLPPSPSPNRRTAEAMR